MEKVFGYVSDASKLAEWLPSIVEVRNITGEGEGQQYEWTYKMIGLLLKGQSTVVEYVPDKCIVHQSIGMINSTWTIGVTPHDEGSLLTIYVKYDVPVPVLGKLAEQASVRRDQRDLDAAFANVKELLES